MLAADTTVVVVVAPGDARPLDDVRAGNAGVLEPDPAATLLDRAVAAAERARRTGRPYLLHDADPLAAVAEAWARRYDGQGAAGELEVAVADPGDDGPTRGNLGSFRR